MQVRPDVLIVGAGVSGLSSALYLAREGFAVEIVARTLPLETTSCAAAAMWAPYLVTDSRLKDWSLHTYRELTALGPAEGVREVRGREVARTRKRAPAWMRRLPHFQTCRPAEVPDGFVTGWWYRAPLVDMPVYLATLSSRLNDLAVPIRTGTVGSLRDALGRARIVVNCTGVGARDLVADPALTPVRGQLVVVENPGIDEFFAEHEESETPTYFLPHGDKLVLGGSAQEKKTSRIADPAISAAIQQRCENIDPKIRGCRFIENRVGLRPRRARVRLERVAVDDGYVVHNYGHGGAGITLSWGCAREVLQLVREVA